MMPGIIGFPQLDPGYDFGGRPPEPEEESGPKPPPGIEIPGHTPTPGYGPLPAPPISLPAPPPGIPVTGYTPPNAAGESAGGQGSTGSSQTEARPDAGQAAEDTSAQAGALDVDELGDDFGTYYDWIPGINVDRQSAHSNPDVILVQQDIETRPLIFQHCFQHSSSRQDAMEYVYAFPPEFDEDELRYLQQTAENQPHRVGGMGGGGTGDTYDSGFTNSRSLIRYEQHLESKYGIQIEWSDASHGTNKAEQLNNLAQAVSLIVNYLAEEVYDGDESAALFVFRQFFGLSEFGRLVVNLGADDKLKKSTYGMVPLAYYNREGKLTNQNLEELNQMYLGSAVNISTIVHEFGHVIDRSVQIVWRYENDAAFQQRWKNETGEMPLSPLIYTNSIEGIAAKQNPNAEVWADIFMTMVLDRSVSGRTYQVFSVSKDDVGKLKLTTLLNCECDEATGKCKYCNDRDVEWRRYKNGNLKNNARGVMEYMPDMLAGVMNPSQWRWIDESDLENL